MITGLLKANSRRSEVSVGEIETPLAVPILDEGFVELMLRSVPPWVGGPELFCGPVEMNCVISRADHRMVISAVQGGRAKVDDEWFCF